MKYAHQFSRKQQLAQMSTNAVGHYEHQTPAGWATHGMLAE